MNETLLQEYPEIVAVVILIVGLFSANFLAVAFDRGIAFLESHIGSHSALEPMQTAISRDLLRRTVYYLTLGFFVLLSLRLLGITVLTELLDLVIGAIPQLITGVAIILAGYVAGIMVYGLIVNAMGPGVSKLLPRLAQIAIVVAAVMTGLGQMAINVSFISYVIIILLVTFLGGLSLAFALGSRRFVANVLARRDLQRYKVGDRLRLEGIEGTVVETTTTAVLLQTADGIAAIPAHRFADAVVIRLDTP